MKSEILKTEGRAKRAHMETVHGSVETPVFMNVGTVGAIKGAVATTDLHEIGTQIELSNTYHLHVRPGDRLIHDLGGLHRFMNWDRPILTDSGGFQVFSLAGIRKIKEEGVTFRSHIDGHKIFMGPEESMQIQSNLASTIAMAFDECPPALAERSYIKPSVERTTRWLIRCKNELDRLNALPDTINPDQLLFGINQGGIIEDIRIDHAKEIAEMNMDGYAVGGVSVGEPEEEMYRAVEASVPFLPEDKPRYVMGLGVMHQMAECVARGVDMFDCVIPTRIARHGTAITRGGNIAVKAAKYAFDQRPVEEGCDCPCCRGFSRSYIRHLLNCGEILGLRLLTMHNVYALNQFMAEMRAAIADGTFAEWMKGVS